MTEWTWRLRATVDDAGEITKMVVEDERGSLEKDWAEWDAEHEGGGHGRFNDESGKAITPDRAVAAYTGTSDPASWSKLDDPWSQALHAAVRDAPESKTELWSGKNMSSGEAESKYAVGTVHEMPIASFTPSRGVASGYAGGTRGAGRTDGNQVLLHLDPGVKALDASKNSPLPGDKEKIVSGPFVVTDITRNRSGNYQVNMAPTHHHGT